MTENKISKEQVKHVAKLSNLSVEKADLEVFAEMFTETMTYVDIIEELNTNDLEGTSQVTGLTNVFQEKDENKATLSNEEALSNAKSTLNGLFVTEAVFDRS